MTGKSFVDTNILVYAHDRLSGLKHDRARALVQRLWETGEGVLSTQVLQEFCVSLRRKVSNPVPTEKLRQLVSNYLTWQIVVNTPDSTLRALEIEERYQISFWDALILQAAESGGAEVIYSEDLNAGQTYSGVRVLNPFVNTP